MQQTSTALPGAMMDAEDARLAEAEAAYPRDLAALPAPPNVAAIDALYASLRTAAALVGDATGDELRAFLDDFSASVTVSTDGVRITWGVDPHGLLIRSGTTRVPKGGKGLR